MYNIFKRPMFKLGGQADQGTGIMSTVEPKQTMRQNPYTGYAIGGRIMAQGGYDPRGVYFGPGPDPRGTYFGPGSRSTGTTGTTGMFDPFNPNPRPTNISGTLPAEERGLAARQKIAEQATRFGRAVPKMTSTALGFGRGFLGPAVTSGLGVTGLIAAPIATVGALAYSGRPRNQTELNYMKITPPPSEAATEEEYAAYSAGKNAAYNEGVAKGEQELTFFEGLTKPKTTTTGLDKESGNFATGVSEEKELLPKNIPDSPKKDSEFVETDTSKPFNLLDEVKKESAELRELLGKDDNLTAEAALVLSEALGTPGTIAQKIQRGLKAAVPLKKAKIEQDKAITLTAYKLAKEKEQQQIRAGTLPTSIREAEYIARSLKESGDPKYANMSVQQIMNENIRAAKPMSPESRARTEVLVTDRQIIRDTTDKLLKAKIDLEKLDPVKDKVKYDKTKELYDKSFREFERDYLSAPEFKSLYEGIYNIFAPQMNSRTMKAGGGLTEDEKEPDVITSNVNFGGTTTPIKPVEKLDYATLRDRLPKEINDQVVQLLASSEQALQDFAYITSQNDVNNFNVKYGVNLIIPPAQQTS